MAGLEGFDELIETLQEMQIPLGDKRKLIANSLRKGAQPILDQARSNAPFVTGHLLSSVAIEVIDQSAEGAEARVGVKDPGFYGRFDERGTAHQPARPWLGPAFDDREDEAYEIIAETLGDGIEDIWNGNGQTALR